MIIQRNSQGYEDIMEKELISWSLVILGWLVSSTASYLYGLHRANAEKTESLFLEISLLVETLRRVYSDVVTSLYLKQPPESRASLWTELERVRNQYNDNRSRYNFLLSKYFNEDIRSGVIQMLEHMQMDYPECKIAAEKDGGFADPLVPFIETWDGNAVPDGPNVGIKWKMVKMIAVGKSHKWERAVRSVP